MPAALDIFTAEGTVQEVTGNHPLLLHDPEAVWLVESGRVDVFAVPVRAGRPAGARIHLCRAEAGQALFGMAIDPSGTGTGVLAVGIPGCRVLRLSRDRLRALASDPANAAAVVTLLDGWVQCLTAGVAGGLLPRPFTLLRPGEEVRCGEAEVLSPAEGTLWVRQDEGITNYLGKRGLVLRVGDGPFPLAGRGWLTARAGTSLTAVPTAALLGDAALWSGLERFHKLIRECVAQNAQESAGAERLRLRLREEADQRLVESTLSRLAAVAQSRGGDYSTAAVAVPEFDVLYLACLLVGKAQGIDIQPAQAAGGQRKRGDAVGAIARTSRVRARRVVLAGEWWREDNGPLLAFRAEDDYPVALLPTSATAYELVDGLTRERRPVSEAVAATLAPFAYSFYRPFPPRALTAWDVLRFAWPGNRRDLLIVALMGLAGGLLGLATPLATGLVFDRIIPGAERGQLLLLILALAVTAVAGILFQLTESLAILRMETRMDGTVEAGVWDRLLGLPVPFFRRYTAGDLAVRAMGISSIRQVLTDVALGSVLNGVFSLLYFGLLFYYSPRLALIACVLILFLTLVSVLAARAELRYQRGIYEARGRIAGLVLALITGIARLRVAGAEDRALSVWGRAFGRQRRLAFRAQRVSNMLAAFEAAMPLVTQIVLFAALTLPHRADLSLGAFLAFSVAFYQVLGGVLALSGAAITLVQLVPLYEWVKPILQTPPEVDPVKADPGELSGDIDISSVSFRYQPDGPLVLDGVSVQIHPGEFVAFVGPSGAGKSTLVRLLLGFETPTAGAIYYDRADLAGLDRQAVRHQIGVVLQSGKLMPGDIFSNIVGSSLLTLDDAWEAARLAGLDEDIRRMPMQMHTVLGEGESTLSGGQRQRLLIARAVVARPRVLLFDEATSALDNETQAVVSRSLEGLKATRVVVAHRLSTVRNADRIYVLEGGKVVQQGRYDELIGQPGLFAELARRQLA
jgi:NHLM bacteriocin system ABC transporter ATP-binding protein